jgi:cytochrome c biogenesis factor
MVVFLESILLVSSSLNPLLQDPGMIIHPPLLYMGYVGFSVAFAFAIAALLSGRLDAAWARWSRPWTTVAWVFLTAGIAVGSGWAYYELGWGGWWFWDPVENASFMPWLLGTALMHSLAVTEKRGAFRSWTVLLAIGAFSLSLLGTFLVRSGVITSVHAFATDPKRGLYILALLVIVIGCSLLLYAMRAPQAGWAAAASASCRARPAARQQRAADRGLGLGAARHAVSAVPRCPQPRQDLGRPAVLRGGVRAADDAGGGADRDGQKLGVMFPEKRIYTVQRMPMTEAAIDSGILRDLYVALGEPVDVNTWILRIQHKPLVGWIWWGCVLMALGGLLAASDRRYRVTVRRATKSEVSVQPAGSA